MALPRFKPWSTLKMLSPTLSSLQLSLAPIIPHLDGCKGPLLFTTPTCPGSKPGLCEELELKSRSWSPAEERERNQTSKEWELLFLSLEADPLALEGEELSSASGKNNNNQGGFQLLSVQEALLQPSPLWSRSRRQRAVHRDGAETRSENWQGRVGKLELYPDLNSKGQSTEASGEPPYASVRVRNLSQPFCKEGRGEPGVPPHFLVSLLLQNKGSRRYRSF